MAGGGLAAEGLALIQRIYHIEKIARVMSKTCLRHEAKLTPEQRKVLRNEKARPIWDELRGWLDAKRGHAPPQTLVGKAMTFLDNQWPLLIRVLVVPKARAFSTTTAAWRSITTFAKMQSALLSWAGRHGCSPIRPPVPRRPPVSTV